MELASKVGSAGLVEDALIEQRIPTWIRVNRSLMSDGLLNILRRIKYKRHSKMLVLR
jgi:hypothetical protein